MSGAAGVVGIVVVAYGHLDHTRACLRSLAAAAVPGFVILVDNASPDGTAEAVRREFLGSRCCRRPRTSALPAGNNVGIARALERGATAVLLLNNDTEVAPDFLAHMLPHADAGAMVSPQLRAAAGGPPVLHAGRFDMRRGVLTDFVDPAAHDGPVPVAMASGCCLLVPAAVIRLIGTLDDRFFLSTKTPTLCSGRS